jgi:hypothetical protein
VIRKALRTTPASPAKLTYEIGVSGAHLHRIAADAEHDRYRTDQPMQYLGERGGTCNDDNTRRLRRNMS